jgi:lysine decarboxylase
MLLARTERIAPAALERGFDTTITTSPAGAILASIDAARALLVEPEGPPLLTRAVAAVAAARRRFAAGGLRVPSPADFSNACFDPMRLVIQRTRHTQDLRDAARRLAAAGTPVEMSDRDTIIAIVGIIDPQPALDRLVSITLDEVGRSDGGRRDETSPPIDDWAHCAIPDQALTPREAFFAAHEQVVTARAVGRVCAEVVAPYPPGIPILIPGEIVDANAIEALTRAAGRGVRIAYAADPSLRTLRVVSHVAG